MPTDPVDQLRALGDKFDELVPPVTMNDLRGRPSRAGRGRLAVRVFAAAAAVATLVAIGAIVLRRGDEVVPTDSAPTTSVIADEEIAAALAAWEESGPSSYHLAVATTHPLGLITVECEFHVEGSDSDLIRGPIRLTANDAPSQMPDLRACSTQPSTVEGLLALILQHRSEGHEVPATFDQRGVPTHFGLDVDLAAADGSMAVEVTVSDPLVLPTVTLSAADRLVCGPPGGDWVQATVVSDLVGLTARVVVDEWVIAGSEPTESTGTVNLSFGASNAAGHVPSPDGKVGELQVIDGDGYVLARQRVTITEVPPGRC